MKLLKHFKNLIYFTYNNSLVIYYRIIERALLKTLKCITGTVKIAPGAVVCVESEIRGDVTIGPRTVIHPKARIIAEAGPIVIGEGNLIEEQTLIINGFMIKMGDTPQKPDGQPF
uniref:Dynactin subunit 6 n=1 Tax=Terrapene triunguis TaxID=2587831 RepID=A0A674INQ6_9SAUR